VKVEPTTTGLSLDSIRDPRLSISDGDFRKLRDFIHEHTGISLADHKRALVCARLAKRLRHLNLQTYGDYYELLMHGDADGRELMEMINAITTNKTDFFREPHHFQFLTDQVFPALRAAHQRRLRVWCAGTSTGEEAYTLAMTLAESFIPFGEWDIKLLATDIDTNVLERAARGVYTMQQLQPVPQALLQRYFMRGTGTNEGLARVKPGLQSFIRFRRLNLIDETWPMQGPFDVIFCRNVLIYFDKALQRKLLHHFASMLRVGGYLMLGHAEAIHGVEPLFHPVGHSIYHRGAGA
jgi:chemotaxis protein methyltransferase CheR